MALKKCHECGHQVSTSAPVCPSCGAKAKKGMGCLKWALLLFVGFIGFSFLSASLSIYNEASERKANIQASADAKKVFEESKRNFENSISEKYLHMTEKKNANDIQGALKILREFETFKRTDYEKVESIRTQLLTTSALERLNAVPKDDIKGLHGVYAELSRLNPENTEYSQKTSKLADTLKQAEIARIAQQSEAIAKAQKDKERKIKESTASLVISKDEVESISWYTHKNSPKSDASKALFIYFGRKNNNVSLRLKITFTADDWLFIKGYIFNIDGVNYPLPISFFRDRKSDNSGGKIWEWVDLSVDAQAYAVLTKIAESKRTILRYEGKQYYSDRDVSNSEKQAISEVLIAYHALGGLPPSR